VKENQNFIKFTAGALVAVELTTFGIGVEASSIQKDDRVIGSTITSKTSEDVNDKYKVALKK